MFDFIVKFKVKLMVISIACFMVYYIVNCIVNLYG